MKILHIKAEEHTNLPLILFHRLEHIEKVHFNKIIKGLTPVKLGYIKN